MTMQHVSTKQNFTVKWQIRVLFTITFYCIMSDLTSNFSRIPYKFSEILVTNQAHSLLNQAGTRCKNKTPISIPNFGANCACSLINTSSRQGDIRWQQRHEYEFAARPEIYQCACAECTSMKSRPTPKTSRIPVITPPSRHRIKPSFSAPVS